ncbi:MAG: DNA methyltransferase, partial [Alkalibacterium sp.]|nr:DNA methyltransferase [Tetragenococcus sp.]MDN6730472.1 DNA methyltransferase [Alkalibacterium sp.]
FYGKYPCHRVVNHAGRLALGWVEQADLPRNEGISLKDASHVDLKKYQW